MTEGQGQGAGDQISDETRQMVTRIRERAAQAPAPAELADLLTTAGAQRTEMSAAEIRALGQDTLALVGRVNYLLGKLSGLLGEEGAL